MRLLPLVLLAAVSLLAGCERFGFESPEKLAAAREAEGKAVGGACRHAGRAIEDCYTLNRRADKAAMFAGWRDMNDYMRENKLEVIAPQLAVAAAAVSKAASEAAPGTEEKEKEKRPAKTASSKAKEAKAQAQAEAKVQDS